MAKEPAIIFTGGDPPPSCVVELLPRTGYVIAADAGWGNALASGRAPDVLVGDMDSVSADHLADARARGIEIIEHSPHKDHTDAEIALELARGRGHHSIIVVSGGGDRFDHLLALVHSMVTHARGCSLEAYVGTTRITFLHGHDSRSFESVAGRTLSLIPLGGDVSGVTTSGLKWELTDAILESFASRGVSNEALSPTVSISIADGNLAILQPLHHRNEPS